MANYTGFSEAKVNSLMNQFNNDSDKLLDELTKQFNKVMDALGENWGTQDAVQHAEETIIPGLTTTGEQIAQVVQSIGATVKQVAELQAADTNNSVSIKGANIAPVGKVKNEMKEKLSNGFVGVYTELEAEVAAALENLGNEVNEKLTTLRNNLVSNATEAFTDAGTSKVADEADSAIAVIQSKIAEAINKVKEDVNTIAKNANQYAKDIQAAGLRQGSAQ